VLQALKKEIKFLAGDIIEAACVHFPFCKEELYVITQTVKTGTLGSTSGSILNSIAGIGTDVTNIFNSIGTPTGQTPKAYINWILFDEQFKPVPNMHYADPVYASNDYVKSHSLPSIFANVSGYIYIYCSNESNQDVYFDNIQVQHTRGPLLEERHYYPQGLTMFALNSRSAGRQQTNFGCQSKQLNSSEFSNGEGLELYDFDARYYDPQLARWMSTDPAGQFASPYAAMGSSFPRAKDPSGKVAFWDDVIVASIGFVTGYVSSGFATKDGWKSVKAGFISAAMFTIGYNTGGAGLVSPAKAAAGYSAAGMQGAANGVTAQFAAKAVANAT